MCKKIVDPTGRSERVELMFNSGWTIVELNSNVSCWPCDSWIPTFNEVASTSFEVFLEFRSNSGQTFDTHWSGCGQRSIWLVWCFRGKHLTAPNLKLIFSRGKVSENVDGRWILFISTLLISRTGSHQHMATNLSFHLLCTKTLKITRCPKPENRCQNPAQNSKSTRKVEKWVYLNFDDFGEKFSFLSACHDDRDRFWKFKPLGFKNQTRSGTLSLKITDHTSHPLWLWRCAKSNCTQCHSSSLTRVVRVFTVRMPMVSCNGLTITDLLATQFWLVIWAKKDRILTSASGLLFTVEPSDGKVQMHDLWCFRARRFSASRRSSKFKQAHASMTALRKFCPASNYFSPECQERQVHPYRGATEVYLLIDREWSPVPASQMFVEDEERLWILNRLNTEKTTTKLLQQIPKKTFIEVHF
jgi:hypothetical protein